LTGLVLGLLVGGYLSGDWGVVLIPALLTAVAGTLAGGIAERAQAPVSFLGGAVLGALTYWVIGRASGAAKPARFVGTLVGLAIATVVTLSAMYRTRGRWK
jgi:hypothetical protein